MENKEYNEGDFNIRRFRKLFIKAREFGLTNEEKELGLQKLKEHLEKNPNKETAAEKIKSPFYREFIHEPIFAWRLRKKVALGICAALIMVYGTMTSFAAKTTLPGDTLYPVKVYFNDKIQTFLAIGPEKRIKVETDLAMARLQEIQKVLESRKIDDQKTRDQIERVFEKNRDILINTSKGQSQLVISKINGTIDSVSRLIQIALKKS